MALVCLHHTSAPAQQAVGRVVVQADGLIWALHIELEKKKNQVLCQVWTWSSTLPDFSGGVSSLAASPKKWSEILSGRRCRRRWPCCCIVFTQGWWSHNLWPSGFSCSWGLQHHWGWRWASALPHGVWMPYHQPRQHGWRNPQQGPMHQAPWKSRSVDWKSPFLSCSAKQAPVRDEFLA